jgi:hypothetical protein
MNSIVHARSLPSVGRVGRSGVRAIAVVLAALLVLLFSVRDAHAQRAAAAPPHAPAPGSWGAGLDSIATWLAQRSAATPCTEHCFVLTRLRLTGAADGDMRFALEGAVLADKPLAVPLFGSPTRAHIDHVTENGKPAAVGFEDDHWFVLTASRHFVIEGSLTLAGDLTLTIPGPLDALDAELARGHVVEGAHLSGLAGLTVHFDRDVGAAAAEPPVFQLSRAVRIGRETTFEYHLVLRSGNDLGVVRLPLAFGEKVLDVHGSTGWTLQSAELVLPTAGRVADITIAGTLPLLPRFEPDSRSAYEWWLVESDVEHRLTTGGDARHVDVAQSPIARTLPNARLFFVARGQHLEVSAQALVATEALAAVVRDHQRKIILTGPGDLVTDDVLTYDNDGIDWLSWPADGRAVFLGTDGRAERLMRQADGARDLLVPLRMGSHSVHLQSLASVAIGELGGALKVPTPSHALTTSHVTVQVGLPARVHPLAVLGGDEAWFAFSRWDAAVLVASIVLAAALLRGRLRRVLGVAVLVGLWFAVPFAWEVVVGATLVLTAWSWARLLPRGLRVVARIGLAVLVLVVGAMARPTSRGTGAGDYGALAPGSSSPVAGDEGGRAAPFSKTPAAPTPSPAEDVDGYEDLDKNGVGNLPVFGQAIGSMNMRRAVGGIAQGVAPVELPLPAYERSVVVSRELVTRDRPLVANVYYITTAGLAPLVGVWLACVAWLARLYAAAIADFVRRLRERLARRSDPDPGPAPAAVPPTAAG